MFWNVVPFYIGKEDRSAIRAANRKDIDAGAPTLVEIFALMPRLEAVVLLGKKAQTAEQMIRGIVGSGVKIVGTWHPSPRCLNLVKARREKLSATLTGIFSSATTTATTVG